MSRLSLKTRLSALEGKIVSKDTNELWWTVEIVDNKGGRGISHATCNGENYARQAHESERGFIARIQSEVSQLKSQRITLISSMPFT